MTEHFRAKLDATLVDFRVWSARQAFTSCRLAHYSGVDLIGAKALPLSEIEPEIESLICEGFYVDWSEHGTRCYIKVWEFGGPEPEWPRVFAELPL